MIPSKTPKLVSQFFGKYIWEKPNDRQEVFLTFDDGPIPEVTPWVLNLLSKYNVKATFFCVGENIEKHPDIFKRLIDEGHQIGNHTFNHLSGWKVSVENYMENIKKTEKVLRNHNLKTKLFRPPYGKLKPAQAKAVTQLGYDIYMWSILSKDYNPKLEANKVYQNLMQTKSGSIIVCHDNIKAFGHLQKVLPKAIEELQGKGFMFKTL
jgi:peptidoglycan/xylan/chitin deacetylase (PgdA/CDA1 family)